jgi:hypothetical protein
MTATSSPCQSDFHWALSNCDFILQTFKRNTRGDELSLAATLYICRDDISWVNRLIAGPVIWRGATIGQIENFINDIALLNIQPKSVQDHLNTGSPTPFFYSLLDKRQRWDELRAASWRIRRD